MKNNWVDTYKKKKFFIKTINPSEIVLLGLKKLNLSKDFKVLDLGCGNGWNSIYIAKLGGLVDSVDVSNLDFKIKLPKEKQNKISFYNMSVMDFNIKLKTYTAIIITRLIQYLNKSELNILFTKIRKGLTDEGIVILSYTSLGGIFDNSEIIVPKFKHSIEELQGIVKDNNLEIIYLNGKSGTTIHVPYKIPNQTYDILIKKRTNL